MARKRAKKSAARCKCTKGTDGRKHCFRHVKGKIKGCKTRGR